MNFNKPLFKLLFLSILILLFVSCGGNDGYGVILWSPDETLIPTGAQVKIISQSTINDSYVVKVMGEKEKIELPMWRVDIYEKAPEMEAAHGNYVPFVEVFANCQRRGLPMRSEPDHQGENTIYKLNENQVVKVLYRQPEMVTIGNLQGYWYKLLTEDGVQGWCFDYYLQVYSLGEDNQVTVENQREDVDEMLNSLLDRPYYPSFYGDKIAAAQVDLNLLNKDHFFMIDSTEKAIVLITPEMQIAADYESIANTGYHSYSFIGTSIRIEAYNSDILSIQYNYQGKEYKEGYTYLENPLEEILQEERARRELLEQEYIEQGPNYSSDTYGKLSFLGGRDFFWQDKSILISRNILNSDAGNGGRIYFNKFLSPSLRSDYRGVLTFRFSNGQELDFLYQWKNDGVLLLLVPQNQINKAVVEDDQFLNPLQIFFHINNETEEDNG